MTHDAQSERHGRGRGWYGDPEGHAEAGRKGGTSVSKNRDHMRSLGRKGGEKVARDRDHMAAIGRLGGLKVSRDRQHMSELGRRGGLNRGKVGDREGDAN